MVYSFSLSFKSLLYKNHIICCIESYFGMIVELCNYIGMLIAIGIRHYNFRTFPTCYFCIVSLSFKFLHYKFHLICSIESFLGIVLEFWNYIGLLIANGTCLYNFKIFSTCYSGIINVLLKLISLFYKSLFHKNHCIESHLWNESNV